MGRSFYNCSVMNFKIEHANGDVAPGIFVLSLSIVQPNLKVDLAGTSTSGNFVNSLECFQFQLSFSL